MRKINRKLGIVQLSTLLVVAFLAATPTANAGEPLCELDWNEDGVVNWDDYLQEHMDGTVSGFYADVHSYVHGPALKLARPNPDLDWNGDGVITMEDAGGPPELEGSFYTQLQRYIDWYLRGYTYLYEDWFPESDCNDAALPPFGGGVYRPSDTCMEYYESCIKVGGSIVCNDGNGSSVVFSSNYICAGWGNVLSCWVFDFDC